MLFRILAFLAVAVPVTLAPAYALAAPDPKVGDELPVGKNATGEECRLRLMSSTQARIPTQRFALYCEGWNVASGELRRGAPPRNDVTAADVLHEDVWPSAWAERLAGCGPVEATHLLANPVAAMRPCRRQEGGWPLVIAAARVASRMYRFQALPTNIRALARGAEMLEGQRAGTVTESPGMLTSAIRRAEALVGPGGSLISVADVGAVETLWALGKRQHYAGDFIASEATHRRVVELHERLMGPSHSSTGLYIAEVAQEVSKQRRFAEADALFERARPLVETSDRAGDYVAYLRNRAYHEAGRGRPHETLRYAQEGVQRLESHPRSPSLTLGALYLAIAIANHHLRQLDAAAIAADRALRLFDKPASNWQSRLWWQGEAYEALGRLQRDRRDYADALRQHELARERRWLMFGETPRVAQSWVAIGLVHRAAGDHAKAADAFRRAGSITAKHQWIRDNIPTAVVVAQVGGLVEASASGPTDQRAMLVADAFVAAQVPRSTITQRAVRAMATRLAAGDPSMAAAVRSLQDSEQARDARRLALAQELLREPEERDAGREARMRTEYAATAREAETHEERLQATFPQYVRLLGHTPASPDAIRTLLRSGEAMLKLLPTSTGTFVFLVTANDVRAHHAPLTATQVQRLVRRLRASVDASAGTVPVFDLAAAHHLYQDLLAPLQEHLAGIGHLIVVPSGPLLGLPLGLLVTRPVPDVARDGDYRAVAWLARDVAISVLPSVTALRDLRAVARPSAAPRAFLGFGNPVFAGGTATLRAAAISQQGCRGDQGWDRAALRALAPLPETVEELRAMAKALGGGNDDVVLGGDATEARVRRTDLHQYRVLAFATHGLLPGEVRCQAEPALALTPGATAARSDDGLLEVSEVAALKLDAEWVVLSACHTGAADGNGGESLSGLTRAFFYAGARSVLASLWAVASHPTATLTTGTVTLKAREPALGRAEALRRSAMSLAADATTSHPFFWAPFILVGDGGS